MARGLLVADEFGNALDVLGGVAVGRGFHDFTPWPDGREKINRPPENPKDGYWKPEKRKGFELIRALFFARIPIINELNLLLLKNVFLRFRNVLL
jgi:hypothetical protein